MIHSEHPFLPGEGDREPVRRFRGRHAAGVAIVTAGEGRSATGLTVSSLVVLEGEPSAVAVVVGPLSDLWDSLEASGSFVVHLCAAGQRDLSDIFAGIRPSPGGLFATVETEPTEYGPVLSAVQDRAHCRVERMEELGYSGLVVGTIDRVELSDLSDPLVHYRGEYRGLR